MTTTTPDALQMPLISKYDREFLHYNPNTDDVVQWVRAYAQAYAAQCTAPIEAKLAATEKQLIKLTDEAENVLDKFERADAWPFASQCCLVDCVCQKSFEVA